MDNVFYQKSVELQGRHWWFIGRKNILRFIFKQLKLKPQAKILDIGTVTGGSLEMLAEFGEPEGLEPEAEAINFYQGPYQIHHGSLPEQHSLNKNHYDLATLLDVIEHIDDDVMALKASLELVKPGGYCVITVPALPFLWSEHDESLHHKRRYTKNSLHQLLATQDNIQIKKLSYFNFVFLLPAILVRFIEKLGFSIESSSHKLPPTIINSVMSILFSCEKYWLSFSGFPLGLSLIAVVKKNG